LRVMTEAMAPDKASRQIRQHCRKYGPDFTKAVRACGITFGLLIVFSTLIVLFPCWPVAILMGCAIVRAFILFHDAAHGSLTSSRNFNKFAAALVQPWIARSAAGWSAYHNHHHKVLGSDPPPVNFPQQFLPGGQCFDDSRTVLFSEQEFNRWPLFKKVWVRIFREPFLFFCVIVPAQWLYRPSEWPQQVQHICVHAMFYVAGGYNAWLCFVESLWVALIIAGLLFHLQHQVNPGYWKNSSGDFDHDDACVEGSSYLLVPWCFKWVTLGIEYHHIHHLSVRVPCYELQSCHEACDPVWLQGVVSVPAGKALRSCFHAMWDEDKQRFTSFDVYRLLGLED